MGGISKERVGRIILFNEKATHEKPLIIGGQERTSRLLDYAYPDDNFYHTQVERGEANQWVATKVPIDNDKIQYFELNPSELFAYNNFLSFLVFMDSIQVNNLSHLLLRTTHPDFIAFLSRQVYEEKNHSSAYGYMLNSILSREKASELVNVWEQEDRLKYRMRSITKVYQDDVDKQTDETFAKSMIANFLLEGVYFYVGFNFFHNLASMGKMMDSNNIIRYIKRDELIHCAVFAHAINDMFETRPDLFDIEMIHGQFMTAYRDEIAFSEFLYDDKIMGITQAKNKQYLQYLINKRLKQIHVPPLFDDIKNPYKHLEQEAGIDDETSLRANEFETTAINYQTPEVFTDWDLV